MDLVSMRCTYRDFSSVFIVFKKVGIETKVDQDWDFLSCVISLNHMVKESLYEVPLVSEVLSHLRSIEAKASRGGCTLHVEYRLNNNYNRCSSTAISAYSF